MTPDPGPHDPFGVTLMARALGLIWDRKVVLVVIFLPLFAIWLWVMEYLATFVISEALSADGNVAGRIALRILLFNLVLGVGGAILAVMWHRSVLCPERMAPPPRRVLGYIGWSLLLWLMIMLITGLPGLVTTMLLPHIGFQYFFVVTIVFWCLSLLASWLTLRAGLVLPAAAVGEGEMDMIVSMTQTGGRGIALWCVALCQVLIWQGAGYAGDLLRGWTHWAAEGVAGILLALSILFGLAVLTALYKERQTPRVDA